MAPSMNAHGVSVPIAPATMTKTMKMPSTGAMFDKVLASAPDMPIAPCRSPASRSWTTVIGRSLHGDAGQRPTISRGPSMKHSNRHSQ
jgi:hypothetical protein